MSKLTIRDKDLIMLREYSKEAFKRRQTFVGLESDEMQLYCILVGIHSFLHSKGVDPGFTVEGYVEENCEPIED